MESEGSLFHSKIGDRGYSAFVSKFNSYLMVHVRKLYEDKLPTKYGIALTTKEWNIWMNKTRQLNNLIEQMQEALEQGEKDQIESESYPVGFRGFYTVITEFRGALFVHIRKFDDNGKPTNKGVALTVKEWQDLLNMREQITETIKPTEVDEEPPAKKQRTENTKRRLFKANI